MTEIRDRLDSRPRETPGDLTSVVCGLGVNDDYLIGRAWYLAADRSQNVSKVGPGIERGDDD